MLLSSGGQCRAETRRLEVEVAELKFIEFADTLPRVDRLVKVRRNPDSGYSRFSEETTYKVVEYHDDIPWLEDVETGQWEMDSTCSKLLAWAYADEPYVPTEPGHFVYQLPYSTRGPVVVELEKKQDGELWLAPWCALGYRDVPASRLGGEWGPRVYPEHLMRGGS